MMKYNDLQVDGLRYVLQNHAAGYKSLEIDFFIVGAVARNLWYVDNGKKVKGREDIDLGVYVTDQQEYDRFKTFLKKNYLYTVCSESIWGLILQTVSE
jgi:hypothetical protein